MAKSIEIKGLDRFVKRLNMSESRMVKALTGSLFREGTAIIGKAKEFHVPVETGALRSSGNVSTPVVTTSSVKVSLGFGGAAAPYALAVHEAPTSYNWSVPGTGPKYLEIPARKSAIGMAKRIERDLKGKL